MSSKFDWQAEDEKEWDEFAPESGPKPARRWPRRRLLILGFALATAVVLAAVFFSRFDRFLDDSAGGIEQDVLASHNLILEAASAGDGELFAGLVLDRLQEWTDGQTLLAERGLLLDRTPLGLQLPAGSSPDAIEIELRPDLREALVSADYSYWVGVSESGADTVILRQLFSYRLQDEQWLMNPPTAAFWGPWLSTSGRYLTLHYPQRDEQISRRLAADLEAVIGQTCHSVADLNCPAGLHLDVVLAADPAALVDLSEPDWRLSDAMRVDLPTPSLIGLPVDESGYRAIKQAYAQRIATRVIAELTGLAQNRQAVIGSAIVDLLLARQGLSSWSFASQAAAPSSDRLLSQAAMLWNRNDGLQRLLAPEDMRPAYALVDFVASEWSEVPPAEMLRLLDQASGLQSWLQLLHPTGEDSVEAAYERYVAARFTTTTAQVWPDEIVLMLCDQGVVGSANLYQYDPVGELLSIVASGREFIHMEALPNGDGVLLTELLIKRDGERTFLWQGGRLTPVMPEANELQAAATGDPQRPALGRAARQDRLSARSSDGRWLAELGDGLLTVSGPDKGDRQRIEHGGRDCRAVAWARPHAVADSP